MRIMWRSGVSIEYGDVRVSLDPQKRGSKGLTAFISHAHFDHSRVLKVKTANKFSSRETASLASAFGYKIENWSPLSPGERLVLDDVEVVPYSSGHVLGSYEFEVSTPNGTVLFTGDFNTKFTRTMRPAEAVPCDVLVLEATFGSPNFIFPSEDVVAEDMIRWAEETIKCGKIPAFKTDPLGNAQEIISIFNEATDIPVVTHWKVSRVNRVYEEYGYRLDYIDAGGDEAGELFDSGGFIFIVPKGLDLSDDPRFAATLVSGWAIYSRGRDFPLSDHADYKGLMSFVEECNPKLVLTCHGGRFDHVLARCIEKELRIRAYPIRLITTSLTSKADEYRLRRCESVILKFTGMPGFTYTRDGIVKFARDHGFSRSEVNMALERLIERGILKMESSDGERIIRA